MSVINRKVGIFSRKWIYLTPPTFSLTLLLSSLEWTISVGVGIVAEDTTAYKVLMQEPIRDNGDQV